MWYLLSLYAVDVKQSTGRGYRRVCFLLLVVSALCNRCEAEHEERLCYDLIVKEVREMASMLRGLYWAVYAIMGKHKGVCVPLTPPFLRRIFFVNILFSKSLSKICILCTPP